MSNPAKDLFGDTTMSFGEHLEALRSHLWKAIAGVAIGCVICLFFGTEIVGIIRWPLDQALAPTGKKLIDDTGANPLPHLWAWITGKEIPKPVTPPLDPSSAAPYLIKATGDMEVEVPAKTLIAELHRVLPQQFPKLPTTAEDQTIKLTLSSPEIELMQQAVLDSKKPVALSPRGRRP